MVVLTTINHKKVNNVMSDRGRSKPDAYKVYSVQECAKMKNSRMRKLFEWSNQMTGYDDPDNTADPAAASMEVLGYAYQMAAANAGVKHVIIDDYMVSCALCPRQVPVGMR